MGFSAPFREPIMSPVYASGVVSAAVSWWLLGNVTSAQCVAAYAPKGAASLAASYKNLNNPGTNDAAPGTAPTWDATNGWKFSAVSTQWLDTGIVPSSGYSIIVRFSTLSTVGWIMGAYNGTGNNRLSIGSPNADYKRIEYGSGKTVNVDLSNAYQAGVLAVAGQQGYRDGVSDGGAIGAWTGSVTASLGIAKLNGYITYCSVYVQAAAIYNVSISSTQVGLISAAMAAL